MRLVAVIFLYFVCEFQKALFVKGGADDGRAPERILGEVGHTVTLPCHDLTVNVTPGFTKWLKDGSVVVKRNHTSSELNPKLGHLIILENGTLFIIGLMTIDEGLYTCECSTQNTSEVHNHTGVYLQIVSDLNNATLDISPVEKLPNGTLYVRNGTTVHFKCSSPSISYVSRTLSLTFEGANSRRDTLVSGNGSLIQFELNITPNIQGVYSCSAENSVSKKTVTKSLQLLVYYPPERHPECTWKAQTDSSSVLFICSWHGGYPTPTLQWQNLTSNGVVLNYSVNETLEVMLNRSLLSDGQELKCQGKHVTMSDSEEKFCHLTLKMPFPEGEPLVTVVEGSNVTLTCTEKQSIPPAKTIWQRTVAHKDIPLSSKYIISEQGPTFSLTIVNVTKDDEGTYFCRSENPIDVRELEIYLTVKSSASYAGGIVGTFLSVLILGAGISIGMAIYSNRHKICLGYRFGFMMEERNDVLNLVESDDEEIFQDAVPRLPVLPNGHSTTLVEIHRIPSSDHEDQENTVESQENQNTVIVAE